HADAACDPTGGPRATLRPPLPWERVGVRAPMQCDRGWGVSVPDGATESRGARAGRGGVRRLGVGLMIGLALLGLGLPATGRAAAVAPEPAFRDGLYRVDQVVDGGTLRVVGVEQRVRLAGMIVQPVALHV